MKNVPHSQAWIRHAKCDAQVRRQGANSNESRSTCVNEEKIIVREIGVYWYLFSNHYSLRCIYVERKQRKRAQLLLGVLELYKSSLLLAFSCFAR